MPLEFYKVIHYLGLALLFVALGGTVSYTINGGDKEDNKARKLIAAGHGTAMLLLLVAGFGMLAKLGASVSSAWVIGKLVIWLVLGGALAFIPKAKKDGAKVLLFVLPLLAAAAAYLAIHKPNF